jgi:hypothetical protein
MAAVSSRYVDNSLLDNAASIQILLFIYIIKEFLGEKQGTSSFVFLCRSFLRKLFCTISGFFFLRMISFLLKEGRKDVKF